MPWNLFLNLLDRITVNISRPKYFYSQDFEWSEQQAIFTTTENRIARIRDGKLDEGETQEMSKRWKIIKFEHQYLGDKVNYDLISCSSFFAKLILDAPLTEETLLCCFQMHRKQKKHCCAVFSQILMTISCFCSEKL